MFMLFVIIYLIIHTCIIRTARAIEDDEQANMILYAESSVIENDIGSESVYHMYNNYLSVEDNTIHDIVYQINELSDIEIINHNDECEPPAKTMRYIYNPMYQTAQLSKILDPFKNSKTIRHITDVFTDISILFKQKMPYYHILMAFWNVRYGYYSDDPHRVCRFYISYENIDDMTIIRQDINGCTDKRMLANETIRHISGIYKHFIINTDCITKEENAHQYASEPSASDIIKHKRTSYVSTTSGDIVEYRHNIINWIGSLLDADNAASNLNCNCNTLRHFSRILKETLDYDVPTERITYHDYMHFIISAADELFTVFMMPNAIFKSVTCMHFINVYKQQLAIFLNSELNIKLLLVPEIMSLRQYTYDMQPGCMHAECVSFYILSKFEVFVKYFKHLLTQSKTSVDRISDADVLLFRIYVAELYMTYVHIAIFKMSCSECIGYVCINRMLLLSFLKQSADTCIQEGYLCEFILFNYVDMIRMIDLSVLHVNMPSVEDAREFINGLIRRMVMYDESVLPAVIDNFVNNVRTLDILIDIPPVSTSDVDVNHFDTIHVLVDKVKEELVRNVIIT